MSAEGTQDDRPLFSAVNGNGSSPPPLAVAGGQGSDMSTERTQDDRPLFSATIEYSSSPPPLAVAGGDGTDMSAVATLCREFAEICRSAVDPMEIASALEFEGIGDRTALFRYGSQDVFALAQEMYQRVPRRPAEPEPAPEPWQTGRFRPLLHALLYAAPAVCFPAAGALLAGPGALPTLVVALLVAWGLSQGLASLGYSRLGTTDEGQAQRVLRAGFAVGLTVVGLAMTAMWLTVHAYTTVLLFGAGEGAYMLGACVLMVLGAQPWLVVAIAPAAIGSAAFLLLGRPPTLEHAAWAALVATPVLACAMAVVRTRGTGPRTGPLLVGAELRGAVPAIAFGLVAAGLLLAPVAVGPEGHGGLNTGALLASVPLSLAMGTAEWSLLWYRRRTQRLLRTMTDLRAFSAQARLALLAALLQYLTGAVVLIALAVTVAAGTGLVEPGWAAVPELVGYLALGAAMFLSLLLQSLRARAVPLAASAAALAAEIGLRYHGLAVQVAVPVVLLAVIGSYAAVAAGRAVRHG